jgi:hypothetical protein
VFVLDAADPLPAPLLSFARLLHLPAADWAKAQDKGKLPKPALAPAPAETLAAALRTRLAAYLASLAVRPLHDFSRWEC